MIYLRSLLFHIVFHVSVFVLMVIWLPGLFMHRRASLELGRAWGRTSLWYLDKICGVKVEWRGLENIPPGGGAYIVACKHQSTWETFVLPIKFPDFSYILKQELIRLPFFGWHLRSAEQIGVDRARGGKLLPQLIEKSKAIFAQGRQLFIFPEGTRRPAGAAPAYKTGIAHLYAATGVPVLPAALNAGLFWPRRSFLIYPGTAVIEFLPMIPAGMKPREFFHEMEKRIEEAADRLIEEAAAKDPSVAERVAANRLKDAGERQKAEAANQSKA